MNTTIIVRPKEGLTMRQIEFLLLLRDLRYIDKCDVKNENDANAYVEVKLIGRFAKFYHSDMQRQKLKVKFMRTYGDPVSGFDLRKPYVIYYPF